jgi:sialic acid synthase SpsE
MSHQEKHMAQVSFENLFVLELANNHWGSLDRGLLIIEQFAKVVKANDVRASIKLQFRDVDSFIHPAHRDRTDVRYIKKTRDTQMSWDNLRTMIEAVKAAGMETMVTPFDEVSVDKAVEFGVDYLKIASSDVRDKTLMKKLATAGKPVIASNGGASEEHVDELVRFFSERRIPFALNHCVSLYPSEDSDLQLNQIDYLRHRYPNITIGLSTHEHRDWNDSILIAYAKGARTFERHIDIDHDGVAVSAYCTLPEQADVWFKAFKKADEMCGGSGAVKRSIPEGERRYLDALVRGTYAKRDLPAGHVLTQDDVYHAIPLMKGQVSTREFTTGEKLRFPVKADAPVRIDHVDAGYAADPVFVAFVKDRGLDPLEDTVVRANVA